MLTKLLKSSPMKLDQKTSNLKLQLKEAKTKLLKSLKTSAFFIATASARKKLI
jgi:hypothetical protein